MNAYSGRFALHKDGKRIFPNHREMLLLYMCVQMLHERRKRWVQYLYTIILKKTIVKFRFGCIIRQTKCVFDVCMVLLT